MRVLITGATGFVGRHLSNHLERHGHKVLVVSRRPNVGYDWDAASLAEGVDACDGVVHLASAGVLDQRWNEARRREILEGLEEVPTAAPGVLAETQAPLVLAEGESLMSNRERITELHRLAEEMELLFVESLAK